MKIQTKINNILNLISPYDDNPVICDVLNDYAEYDKNKGHNLEFNLKNVDVEEFCKNTLFRTIQLTKVYTVIVVDMIVYNRLIKLRINSDNLLLLHKYYNIKKSIGRCKNNT